MNLLHRPFVLVFLVITGTAGLVLFSTIYIYIAIVHAQASGYFLYSMQGRYGRKSLFLFGPVPFRLPAHTRRSVPKEKWTKKNEKELLANPNPSLEAVATFCLFCNASLSPACPLNQVTLREFKCTTRDLQLLLITF